MFTGSSPEIFIRNSLKGNNSSAGPLPVVTGLLFFEGEAQAMQVSPSSYAITGLGYVPPWLVNAGMVVGQTHTLIIDTGACWLAGQTIHGYATAVRSSNQLIVFNCEPHFDHIGGNSYFADLGVPIYGHRSIQRTDADFAAEKAEYNDSIAHQARGAAQEAETFFINTKLANPSNPAIDGHLFDLGGIEVEVVATPGHTAINQSIYNRTDNILFCADCIVTDYIPNLEAGEADEWAAWLDSLDRIEGIAPVAVIPGHGQVMHGNEIASQIKRVRRFVEEALEQGVPPTASS